MKYTIQMFGLPREVTQLREVEVELEDGANLADVIAALKRKIPALEGQVIRPGENRLTDYYGFNVNGQFYIDDTGRIQEGDRIALLTLAAGG